MYISISTLNYICMYTCALFMCVHIHVYIEICAYSCVHMYVCVYVYVHVHILYTYIEYTNTVFVCVAILEHFPFSRLNLEPPVTFNQLFSSIFFLD